MGTKKEVKFVDRQINVTKNPVMIVGQNPGRQRKNSQTFTNWEGNRSADFLNWCIESINNLYLTNACNYQQMTEEKIIEGLVELRAKIDVLKPRKIITLGEFASFAIADINPDVEVEHFFHPSFMVRFNKDKGEYRERLRKAILK